MEHKGKPEKTWVFRKNQAPYSDSIKNVAAQRDFYSSPSTNSKTLDDHITQYEGDRLASLIHTLRQSDKPDTAIAAEVIAHLVPRSSHLRNIFSSGITQLMSTAQAVFSDPLNIQKMLGIDAAKPTDAFRKHLEKALDEQPQLKQLGIPESLLERIGFFAAKENFIKTVSEQTGLIGSLLEPLILNTSTITRDGHNNILAQSIVPEKRLQELQEMDWIIADAPSEGVILPDCVAVGIMKDGNMVAMTMATNEEISGVIMPLTSRKLLVGRLKNESFQILGSLNKEMASCCDSFFIADKNIPELLNIQNLIGEHPTRMVNDLIDDAFKESLPGLSSNSVENHKEKIHGEVYENQLAKDFNYQITFRETHDAEKIQQLANTTKYIVAQINRIMPLNRLDGITFADNYEAALQEIDRGFLAAPLTTVKEEIGIGIAQSPYIRREGVVKSRIIMRASFAFNLIGGNPSDTELALHTLVGQLAEVALLELFDSAFPGVLLTPYENEYDGFLYRYANPAINAYFSARMSAGFGECNEIEAGAIELFLSAIERAQKTIPEARLAYRFDHNLDQFLSIMWAQIDYILQLSAKIIGHSDGIEKSPFDGQEALNLALEKCGLRAWFDVYQSDLRRLWDNREKWASVQEFLDLGLHVERIAWQYGVFLWDTGDEIRVEIPLGSDAAILEQQNSAIL